MLIHYMYHIWFRVCRPFRNKYKLSTNCLMVLNGAYIYNKAYNKSFTRSQLLKFVGYYDNVRIGKYMTVLMEHNFISLTGQYKNRYPLYNISELGIQVMSELNISYNNSLYLFCSSHGIEL